MNGDKLSELYDCELYTYTKRNNEQFCLDSHTNITLG